MNLMLTYKVETTPAMFFNTVKYYPENPAMKFKENGEWKTINYTEFAAIVADMGFGLIKKGFVKGDRAAIMAHTCPAWLWCDMAIQAAGGITVCIYPTLTTSETIHISNNAGPKFIFVGDSVTARRIFSVKKEMPGLEAVICLEKGFCGNGNDLLNLDDIINTGREFAKEKPEVFENTWKSVQGDDGATIIYTSGTTGVLKGVFYNQLTWIEGLAQSVEHMDNGGYEITSNDTTLAVMPLTHVWERENSSLGILGTGGLIGFAESPKTVLQDIVEVSPTWILLVPRLWSRIFTGIERTFGATEEGKKLFEWAINVGLQSVDYYTDSRGGLNLLPLVNKTWADGLPEKLSAEWRKADELVYSKVRAMFGGRLVVPWSGGARLPVDLHRKWVALSIPVMTGWGLSETSAGMAHDNHVRIKFGYVNHVLPGATVEVQPDGELWARGRGVASGYFNDPKNTSQSFENGWFKTGDIGEIDDEGYVRITDRKKMIIVLDTGKKVAPARIEEIICRSLLIDQLVVTGEDKKFISALIVPVFDNLIAMLESQGATVDKTDFVFETINGISMCTGVPQEFIDMPAIKQVISMEIKKANEQLDDFETIKNYHVLNKRFSEGEGEVTPTQKVKVNYIIKKYSDLIEDMYK